MRVLRKIGEVLPGGDGLGASAEWEDEDRSCIRADRARTELRRGRPIALAEAEGSGPVLLASAIETLDVPRWAALQRWGRDWRLLLTGERYRALGGDRHADALALRPPPGPLTVEALRELAGVSHAPPASDAGPVLQCGDAQAATDAMQAALELARGARLAPAFVVTAWPAGAAAALAEAEVLRLSPADVRRAGRRPSTTALRRISEASVALAAHEDCRLVVFGEADGDAEHVAVVVGRPDLERPVPVRVHSSCLTGDLLGSLRCDCGDQLRHAVGRLAATSGVLLYLAQEGRGIGLANKLRAYRLQDEGLDTFEADRQLGFGADLRDFAPAAAMLGSLGIRRVHLLTHNPRKIESLRRAGIEVVDRLELAAPLNPHNARYVAAKREQAGHYA